MVDNSFIAQFVPGCLQMLGQWLHDPGAAHLTHPSTSPNMTHASVCRDSLMLLLSLPWSLSLPLYSLPFSCLSNERICKSTTAHMMIRDFFFILYIWHEANRKWRKGNDTKQKGNVTNYIFRGARWLVSGFTMKDHDPIINPVFLCCSVCGITPTPSSIFVFCRVLEIAIHISGCSALPSWQLPCPTGQSHREEKWENKR